MPDVAAGPIGRITPLASRKSTTKVVARARSYVKVITDFSSSFETGAHKYICTLGSAVED